MNNRKKLALLVGLQNQLIREEENMKKIIERFPTYVTIDNYFIAKTKNYLSDLEFHVIEAQAILSDLTEVFHDV